MNNENKIKKIVATIYQYFVFRKLRTPYFRTIFLIVFFIMLLSVVLFAVFPIPWTWYPFSISKKAINNYFYGAIFLLILYLILSLIFKKKEINQYPFWEEKVRTIGKWIVIYASIICIVLVLLGIFHVRKMW